MDRGNDAGQATTLTERRLRWRLSPALAAGALTVVLAAGSCAVPPADGGGGGTTTTTTTTTPSAPTTTRPGATTTLEVPGTTLPHPTSVPPTTAAPTTLPPTPTTTTPDTGQTPFPGAVPAGNVRWGAAIGGNGDPARHEDAAVEPLALRRTFWRWDQRTTTMITTARDDLANDRLPWVSIKPGGSWQDMGSGRFDGQIDEMLRALDQLDGPVWFTLHHEPEGGGGVNSPDDPGGAPAWRAMQQRIRDRMTALGTDNVAFAPILMSWTWDSRSGRDPGDWWVPGVWDFYGFDHYTEAEGPLTGTTWASIRRWAGDRDLPLAVGEWGMRGDDADAGQRVRDWYAEAVGSGTDGKGAQVIGLAAFDSDLNSSTGGWELQGGQLDAFQSLLSDPRTLTASEP